MNNVQLIEKIQQYKSGEITAKEIESAVNSFTAVKQSDIDAAKEYADSRFVNEFDELNEQGKKLWYAYYNGYLSARQDQK